MRMRIPRPSLRPFVESIWAADDTADTLAMPARREHVLPTGHMHLVLRLADDPLRIFDDVRDVTGRVVGTAVVGGARETFYVREASNPNCSVGALLRPGAAEALFGVPAHELSRRHTPLDDLWGASVESMRDELAGLPVEQRLDRFEAWLTGRVEAARAPRLRGLHPAIAQALEHLPLRMSVGELVRRSGCSHRTFISLFCRSVGLTPKAYCRVRRFQRALGRAAAPERAWVDVAIAAGYSDQPHFTREFRAFAGVTPTEYRRRSPRQPLHLPVDRD
jgi:AraC-like DNA-binding protein